MNQPNYDAWTMSTKDNCYNYAISRPTGDYLQPGQIANGKRRWNSDNLRVRGCFDIDTIIEAALEDGLLLWNPDIPVPEGFHLVQFFIRPGKDGDYHWYRQDPDGTWSHKPGWEPPHFGVTNVEKSAHRWGYKEPGAFMISPDRWEGCECWDV